MHESEQTRSDTPELVLGAALTALIHGLFLAFMLFARAGVATADDPVILPVISAELLRWGEVMPEPGELPTIPNPAPAPTPEVPPERPAPAQPDEQPPAPQEIVLSRERPETPARRDETRGTERRTADGPTRQYRGEHNPNRPITDGPIYGSPDGFIGGTSLSETAIRDQFSRIRAQLQRAFRPPATLTDDELRRLRTLVEIRVTSTGQITGWRVLESSGNRLFDAQVESMLNRFRVGRDRLDLGSIRDDRLREEVIGRGFRIRFPD